MNKARNTTHSPKDLEKILGHKFRDSSLLEQAITHPSLEGKDNFQRLEFLGDRVLGFVIAGAVYRTFRGDDEGRLSRRQAHLVRKETIARIAKDLGLEGHVRMTDTARRAGMRAQQSISADALEAIIGALYLDGGLRVAETFIKRYWKTALELPAIAKDPKSALQEWAQARAKPLPEYTIKSRKGPDHAPRFVIKVSVEGAGMAEAEGASKQETETLAASALLKKIGKSRG